MKISIFACGFSVDNGKSTQCGASAARLEYIDNHNRKSIRVISELVGYNTNPQCDLKATILGLMSINAAPALRLREAPVYLYASTYVAQLLEWNGDSFKLNPKKNIELVRRLREKTALFSNLTVQAGTKEQLQQALDVAKTAVGTGIGNDSGTIIL